MRRRRTRRRSPYLRKVKRSPFTSLSNTILSLKKNKKRMKMKCNLKKKSLKKGKSPKKEKSPRSRRKKEERKRSRRQSRKRPLVKDPTTRKWRVWQTRTCT